MFIQFSDCFIDNFFDLTIFLFLFSYFLLFLSSTCFYKAFYLIPVSTNIGKWVIDIINNHIDDITSTKGISFQIGTVNSTLNTFLLTCSSQDSLFDWRFCHETINMNRFLLTNSMCSIGCLGVHCWIPIIIIENDGVSSNQVDSKTTCSCWKNENKNIVIILKLFNHESSILELSWTIHSEVGELSPDKEVFKDVHHLGHLTED